MTKVVIDDAMVERALQSYTRGWNPLKSASEPMRAALHAALNPPPEPEIVVTEEMMQAGDDVVGFRISRKDSAAIYRAMRKREPKSCDSVRTCADVQAKEREATATMRAEFDKAWTELQTPYCLPWYNRMAGPGAVIPMVDPRVKERRHDDQLWAGIQGSGTPRSWKDRRK